jgi:hypothetical protein
MVAGKLAIDKQSFRQIDLIAGHVGVDQGNTPALAGCGNDEDISDGTHTRTRTHTHTQCWYYILL